MMMTWAILTGEYPPCAGGVSDYSFQVARGLVEAGDAVHVLTPGDAVHVLMPGDAVGASDELGVVVHRLADCFGRRGRDVAADVIDRLPADARVLVQYTPQAFGRRAMNVAFVAWLTTWIERPIDVMFHEVAYPFEAGQSVRRHALAIVNHAMAAVLGRAADRVFVSTTSWRRTLGPLIGTRREMRALPVPSNLPASVDRDDARALRARIVARGEALIGHFGTFGGLMTPMLQEVIPLILRDDSRRMLLIGRGGRAFADQLLRDEPALLGRMIATDALDPHTAAAHLAACDVLVQPYLDGISTRRSSAVAGLALGVPVVTNVGHATEEVWRSSGAVALAKSARGEDMAAEVERLLGAVVERASLNRRAAELYRERFSIERTIAALRDLR